MIAWAALSSSWKDIHASAKKAPVGWVSPVVFMEIESLDPVKPNQ
jgi:hypothetical protein